MKDYTIYCDRCEAVITDEEEANEMGRGRMAYYVHVECPPKKDEAE